MQSRIIIYGITDGEGDISICQFVKVLKLEATIFQVMGDTITTCLTGCSGILMSIYIVGTDTAFSLMSLTLHGGLPPAEGAALLEGMSWSAAKRRAQSAFLDQRCNPGSILRSASSRVKLVVCCLLNADGSLQLLQNCIYHELPWSAVRPVGPILH